VSSVARKARHHNPASPL